MPRASTTNTENHMLLSTLRTHIDKERTYKQGIIDNNGKAICAAGRVSELREQLTKYVEDGILEQSQLDEFIETQRQRLLKITEDNVRNYNQVDAFISTCKALREQEGKNAGGASSQQSNTADGGGAGDENAATDAENADPLSGVKKYDAVFEEMMSEHGRRQQQRSKPNGQHGEYMSQMREVLGLPPSDAAGGSGAGGNGDDAMDEDEDIVCMNNTLASQHPLKCPVTGAMLVDPVKNSVCTHVYSREGIEAMIQSKKRNGRRCRCPVPGCTNANVTADQLEHDPMSETLVRREKRRQDKAAQDRASQAANVDSDDEEEF